AVEDIQLLLINSIKRYEVEPAMSTRCGHCGLALALDVATCTRCGAPTSAATLQYGMVDLGAGEDLATGPGLDTADSADARRARRARGSAQRKVASGPVARGNATARTGSTTASGATAKRASGTGGRD